MRNVLTIPFQGSGNLIVASDNSGAIGMKKDDLVFVPYETTAYYSFRVAVMECMAAGGQPVSVILNNFCGDEAWEKLISGIKKGLEELHLKNVMITGSTESNFSLMQSAIGVTVLGKKPLGKMSEIQFNKQSKIAIIGMPLVGNEVLEQEDQIAPLSLFQKISSLREVMVWPVGSKGILSELNQILKSQELLEDRVITVIDTLKSSGPATCFLVLFPENFEEEIKKMTGNYYYSVEIIKR